MDTSRTDILFAGSIPQVYERHLVPLIFEPYAADLARRVAALQPARVLETAAGTGVVTRALTRALPGAAITATDLSPAMLEQAQAVDTASRVRWQVADASRLPFEDGAFDVVVCQFGVMFFPNKPVAFAEARRVLRPGGTFLFSVWDRLEDNEVPNAVLEALAALYPQDPPSFMRRVPHGYADPALITRDLEQAGFTGPRIETVSARSRADNATDPAIAFCQGTPMRAEIEAKGPGALGEATAACAAFIARRFGAGAVEGKIQAHVVEVRK